MQNPWIGYASRSYDQIKKDIFSKIQDPIIGIPEMIDLSAGNPFVKLISIWAAIAEQNGYYISNFTQESFASLVRIWESLYNHTVQYDYRIKGAFASSGEVTFQISETAGFDVLIPVGTIISTEDGIEFQTIINSRIVAGNVEVKVPVKQIKSIQNQIVISNGSANQTIELAANTVDNSIVCFVGNTQFESIDSFVKSYGKPKKAAAVFFVNGANALESITDIQVDSVSIITDTIFFETDDQTTADNIADEINRSSTNPNYTASSNNGYVYVFYEKGGIYGNGKTTVISGDLAISIISDFDGGADYDAYNVFVAGLNIDQNMEVRFGDGIFGAIPLGAQNININYQITEGQTGNVASTLVNTIISNINLPAGVDISVKNEMPTIGGLNQETILSVKRKLPLHVRTVNRAVTERDYSDIAIIAPAVYNAYTFFECQKTVFVYILPYGGGIAPPQLCNDVEIFFDDKKLVTTNVVCLPIGEVVLLIDLFINIKNGYNKTEIENLTSENIINLLSWTSKEILTQVYISDIYETIEATNGVQNSNINNIKIIPYAEPVSPNSFQLDWSVEVLDAGFSNITWRISFISTSDFNLFKNNVFVGSYTTGSAVSFDEISFVISNGIYTTDQNWEFVTYPNPDLTNGRIILNQNAVITTRSGDITITSEGGI